MILNAVIAATIMIIIFKCEIAFTAYFRLNQSQRLSIKDATHFFYQLICRSFID
jgi:hypothetical protein